MIESYKEINSLTLLSSERPFPVAPYISTLKTETAALILFASTDFSTRLRSESMFGFRFGSLFCVEALAWRRRMVTMHMSTRRRGFSETVDCSMAISCSEIKEEYTCDLVDRSCETVNIIEKCGQQGGF